MPSTLTCIVGVMPSPEAFDILLLDLRSKGFERDQLGVLAAAARHEPGLAELAEHLESEKTFETAIVGGLFYVGAVTALGAVVLSSGGLGVVLLAAATAGGTTAVAGLLMAVGFHRQHAHAVDRYLDRGGLVVWIVPRGASQWQCKRQPGAGTGLGGHDKRHAAAIAARDFLPCKALCRTDP
jgi:hypothetical protein